jgi:acylphosphatase
MIARRLVIQGRVQGVGFRASMIEAALACGIAGWVRNRRDGSVEALLQGEPAAVERAIGWARRGPPSARVTEVEATEEAVSAELAGFMPRSTL